MFVSDLLSIAALDRISFYLKSPRKTLCFFVFEIKSDLKEKSFFYERNEKKDPVGEAAPIKSFSKHPKLLKTKRETVKQNKSWRDQTRFVHQQQKRGNSDFFFPSSRRKNEKFSVFESLNCWKMFCKIEKWCRITKYLRKIRN